MLAAVLAIIGLPVVVLVLAIVVIAVFGVSIDASRWRDALAARASAALGLPVVFETPLEVELGREVTLHVGAVRILNPPDFATSELATLGEARARIDLLAALRGRLRVHSFEAAAGRVRFERLADGRANWAPATRKPPASPAQANAASAAVAIEIERLSIGNFAFEYGDQRSGAHHVFAVDELHGIGKWYEPLKVTLRGHVSQSFPYTLAIEGGSARLLQEARAAWPFTLDFESLGTRLHASGTVDRGRGAARLDFGAGTHDLEQVTGGLVLALDGARPRLSGELAIATLDVKPFLEAAAHRSDRPLTYDELTRQTLPLRSLVPFDADLVFHVRRWLGLALEVSETRLALHVDERGLRAPFSAMIAGAPLTGRIELDTAAATPTLALQLDARDVPLRDLGQRLPGAGLDGKLGNVALRLGARAETLGTLVADLDLRLVIAAARLHYANASGRRPVEFTLDTFEVVVPRGQPVRVTARGTWLGKRATLAIRAGQLALMLRAPATPIELTLTATGVRARVAGTLAWPTAPRGSDLAFQLDARHAGDLAEWLGFAPESNLPFALRGRLQFDSEWRLEDTTLKLGRSELSMDAQHTRNGGKPIIVGAARSSLIDVPELQRMLRRSTGATAHSLEAWLEVPILPESLDLAAADVSVTLARVILGRNELLDTDLNLHIHDGQLAPSPWGARFAGVPFVGLVGLDLRGQVPEASLSMSTGSVDVGALLRSLAVAEDVDAHAGALQVTMVGRGRALRELLEQSSFEVRLQSGDLAVHGPVRRAIAGIRFEQALIAALPGKPITLRMQGALDDTPTELTLSSGTLADFARDISRVPLSVEAKAAGARLTLEGQVILPLGSGGELTLALAGEQLDSLSPLVHAALPPWRSWSVEGPIRMTPTGYEITRLAVRVGQSRLYGRGRLDLAGARPRLDMDLSAPDLQLEDFPFAERTAVQRSVTAETVRATAGRVATQTQDLLSGSFLRRFDAHVAVVVEHVHSGSDRLGDGMLRAQLVDGRLEIEPAEINIPGGGARLSWFYDPTGREVAVAASVRVERFDYAILARRLRPDADLGGLLSLRLELAGKAPTLNTIMTHANGHLDLAAWPQSLRGDIFNRWSVNVFFQLLPFIDPGRETHVNCVVVRADVKDGKVTPDALLIDTSRMRVHGTGGADFATEEIAFRFRPRAKGPVLLSLQPPVDVTGTMTDFRVGVAPGSFLGTVARFLGSVFVVPIQVLTQGRPPADGADVCTDPLR